MQGRKRKVIKRKIKKIKNKIKMKLKNKNEKNDASMWTPRINITA